MLIDRTYSDEEINVIFERGLDAVALAKWPLVSLSDYVGFRSTMKGGKAPQTPHP